jgi:hypothetical protein
LDESDPCLVFDDYVSYVSAAFKRRKRGRPMGGVVVCVRRRLAKFVTRLSPGTKNAIFLRISKRLFELDKDVLYACTYIPPPDSPVFINNPIGGRRF